jgi:predicted DNA repair protein MutK
MPQLLSTLSAVGTVAMLWVGGHILLAGSDHLGWHTPDALVHYAADQVRHGVESVGTVLAWLVDTGVSAVIGLLVGAVVVALMHLLSFARRGRASR